MANKNTSLSWKEIKRARDYAAQQGENIAEAMDFNKPPVDPFRILEAEKGLIYAEGDDFGDAFDGRIEYLNPRYLLVFNTKYNRWPFEGRHHNKVLFTICHELGHFYMSKHRELLTKCKRPHLSYTEFTADPLVEQEADHFAAGLLMPRYLLGEYVNRENFPSAQSIKEVKQLFQVSLTGLLVRWVQLSDFPCAVVCVQNGMIRFGWVSDAFKQVGGFRVKSGNDVEGLDASKFIARNSAIRTYQEGQGTGLAHLWIDLQYARVSTIEKYFSIPYSNTIWIMMFSDEREVSEYRHD